MYVATCPVSRLPHRARCFSPPGKIRTHTGGSCTVLDSRDLVCNRVFTSTTYNASVSHTSPLYGTDGDITSRDLKPDNILLDAMGHAHVTDFNVAIHYSERRMHTSVAGSMAYMAPEVVGRKGYTWCADWWSLGVVAWELLFHKRPFDGRTSEMITHSILRDPLRFPSSAKDICSGEGRNFLRAVSVAL